MSSIRIGAVSYLNTKPLVFGLENPLACGSSGNARHDDENQIELSFDLPSRLADQLSSGELDVALIPSIEVLDHPDYVVVSDACIACHAAVWSVKFLSRVPFDQIRTVALDEGSRTSVAMTKIMLSQYGVRPEFKTLPVEADWKSTEADGLLLIGDRAMFVDQEVGLKNAGFVSARDMGKWWNDWTELPFVFAMWTARGELDDAKKNLVAEVLGKSRDLGLANLDKIANDHCEKYQLTESQCLSYLRDNLHFILGEREKLALEKYYSEAALRSLAPENKTINFYDYEIA